MSENDNNDTIKPKSITVGDEWEIILKEVIAAYLASYTFGAKVSGGFFKDMILKVLDIGGLESKKLDFITEFSEKIMQNNNINILQFIDEFNKKNPDAQIKIIKKQVGGGEDGEVGGGEGEEGKKGEEEEGKKGEEEEGEEEGKGEEGTTEMQNLIKKTTTELMTKTAKTIAQTAAGAALAGLIPATENANKSLEEMTGDIVNLGIKQQELENKVDGLKNSAFERANSAVDFSAKKIEGKIEGGNSKKTKTKTNKTKIKHRIYHSIKNFHKTNNLKTLKREIRRMKRRFTKRI